MQNRPHWERGSCSSPSIHATFRFKNHQLQSVQLTLSEEGFLSQFIDAPAHTQNAIETWIEQYLKGNELPRQGIITKIPLQGFSKEVLTTLLNIPFGTTLSYKDVAVLSGSPLAARAVGQACTHNPFPLLIPCHRVIASSGALGGYAFGPVIKERLLQFERNLV